MKPNKKEIEGIREAIYKYFDTNEDEAYIDSDRIAVVRNYISDCPSWVGDVAFVLFGDVEFNLILRKSKDTWKPFKHIDENHLTRIEDE